MKRSLLALSCLLASLGLAGCGEELPSGVDPDLFPIEARTVEVRVPWTEFGQALAVFGGFGDIAEVGGGVLANDYQGVLQARTLLRFAGFPDSASVRDAEGTTRTSAVSYRAGRIVVRFDTLVAPDRPVLIGAYALEHPWDVGSVTWTEAVDTAGVLDPWPEPGAGPATFLADEVWDPEVVGDSVTVGGDSVLIALDSAQLALLDPGTDAGEGLRLDMETEDERVRVASVVLRLEAVPAIRTDTVLTLTANATAITFVFTPEPPAADGELRVGGVPAFRTVVGIDVPEVITGPPSLCERVGCPLTLRPEQVNAASLVLTTRESPAGFQPLDTVRVDVRPVLAPDRLPRSPLGGSFVGIPGRAIAPGAFRDQAGREVAIPITQFVREQLAGETSSGREPSGSIALLAFFEPTTIDFASFAGAGGDGAPYLRLLVTTTDTLGVR